MGSLRLMNNLAQTFRFLEHFKTHWNYWHHHQVQLIFYTKANFHKELSSWKVMRAWGRWVTCWAHTTSSSLSLYYTIHTDTMSVTHQRLAQDRKNMTAHSYIAVLARDHKRPSNATEKSSWASMAPGSSGAVGTCWPMIRNTSVVLRLFWCANWQPEPSINLPNYYNGNQFSC